jgi:hypothetical protein
VAAQTARNISVPVRAMAVVIAIGASFLTGEEVGATLANTRREAQGRAFAAAPSPSAAPNGDGPAGGSAAVVQERTEIGSDCNTNYR